jgi:drug/metabolite transporter (DMT)-like permease
VQVVFGIVWAAAGAAVESAALSREDEVVRWGWPLGLALLYLATCPSLVAYYAWGAGVARAGPAMAALFSNLTPLLTALLSGAVLGSWPEPYHLLAFALIVAGIMSSALKKR